MASTRTQIVPPTPFQDSGSPPSANVSLGRATGMGNLYMVTTHGTPLLIGGLQSFYMEEVNGTQFRPSAGSDWLEPVYGMRMWQGEGQRWQVRGEDLVELLYGQYPSVQDIDFRYLPFIWQYNFNYENASGRNPIENATWSWMTVIVTRYRWTMPGANDLLSEDFSFIGKGISRTDSGVLTASNPSVLWSA